MAADCTRIVPSQHTVQWAEFSFQNATKDTVLITYKTMESLREISVVHNRRFPPISLFMIEGTTKLTFQEEDQEEDREFRLHSTITEAGFSNYIERIKNSYELIKLQKPSPQFMEKTLQDLHRSFTVIPS